MRTDQFNRTSLTECPRLRLKAEALVDDDVDGILRPAIQGNHISYSQARQIIEGDLRLAENGLQLHGNLTEAPHHTCRGQVIPFHSRYLSQK